MYGDTDAIRKRVADLRDQGVEIRSMADHLVNQVESLPWSGRAAQSMRERVRDRAAHLRDVAAHHEGAADTLDKHLQEVDRLKEGIAEAERRGDRLISEARTRVARHDTLTAERRDLGLHAALDPRDRELAAFTAPPTGHRDWLTVELPD